MNSDVLDTIEAALAEYKESVPWEDWGLDSYGHKWWGRDEEKIELIDTALAEIARLREAGPQWEPSDHKEDK